MNDKISNRRSNMDTGRILKLTFSYLLLGIGLLGICCCGAFFSVQRYSASAHPLANPSFVRVIHASPYVGTADVFVDGSKLLSSFGFGAVTGYATVPAGPHKVQIALVGKGIGASVISETLTVSPGAAYTVAAIGSQPSSLSLQVFVDDNLLTPGSAKLRVYQLSPDAGAVSVAAAGNTLLSGVGYQSASNYLTVASGSYNFNVSSLANNTTLSASASLNANTVESLFVVGMFNGTPKSELVQSQTTGLPNVPNTGSDPNADSQMDGVQPLAPSPLSWPVGIASLLLIAGGVYLRRVTSKGR
jgi:Domain of unknown function (DUF4397)